MQQDASAVREDYWRYWMAVATVVLGREWDVYLMQAEQKGEV